MRDIIDSWFADRLAEGTTKNVNTMAPFLTLAYRYEETGDRTMVPWLDTWAEWAMREMPRTPHGGMQHVTLAEENHHQMWDDTLMMTVLPLTKIGLVLDRPHYVREATFQFLTHVTYLMDRRDRAVVPRVVVRRQPSFRQGTVGPREFLGDHGDPRLPRAAGPAGRPTRSAGT